VSIRGCRFFPENRRKEAQEAQKKGGFLFAPSAHFCGQPGWRKNVSGRDHGSTQPRMDADEHGSKPLPTAGRLWRAARFIRVDPCLSLVVGFFRRMAAKRHKRRKKRQEFFLRLLRIFAATSLAEKREWQGSWLNPTTDGRG
jgi:hypothetical protein